MLPGNILNISGKRVVEEAGGGDKDCDGSRRYERRFMGAFQRSFSLPENVNADGISARVRAAPSVGRATAMTTAFRNVFSSSQTGVHVGLTRPDEVIASMRTHHRSINLRLQPFILLDLTSWSFGRCMPRCEG